jgi:hypothetical protein
LKILSDKIHVSTIGQTSDIGSVSDGTNYADHFSAVFIKNSVGAGRNSEMVCGNCKIRDVDKVFASVRALSA